MNDMHSNSVHRLRERGAAGRLVPHAERSVPTTGLSANSAGARRRLRHAFTVFIFILLPATALLYTVLVLLTSRRR